MAFQYYVTAHKPTAVNACVTGKVLLNYYKLHALIQLLCIRNENCGYCY